MIRTIITSRLIAFVPFTLHFILCSPVDARSFEICAPAFVGSPTSRARSAAPAPALRASPNEEHREEFGGENDRGRIVSRRALLLSTAATGAASLIRPSPARAAAATAEGATARGSAASPSAAPPSAAASSALCDPSVSTWTRRNDDAVRTVHILGTAHVSSASAELAGKIVRDLKPDVVFVELDAKRVAKAVPGGVRGGGDGAGGAGTSSAGAAPGDAGGGSGPAPAPAPGASVEGPASTAPGALAFAPDGASDDAGGSNPFDVRSKLETVGSKYVGNAVKGMYGKLESEGFKAGDEFATSVREGLAIGSTIVLGDRDVEVTLRRLTRALTKTDFRKLLSSDSEINSSMEEMLPEGMKNQLEQSSDGGGGGGGDVKIDREEFETFVETMKTKENIQKIMRGLQSTAPEIYEAMVAERDIYMGRGLDELGLNLKDSSAENTVAVMGMAHVDGVERYLASKGWEEISYPCPVLR